MLGYVGPKPFRDLLPSHPATLIWAAEQRWIDLLTDPRRYDWPRTRKAWYFQAFARSPDASVFYAKAPYHLLLVDELARHFRNTKFLFMVRNPYHVKGRMTSDARRSPVDYVGRPVHVYVHLALFFVRAVVGGDAIVICIFSTRPPAFTRRSSAGPPPRSASIRPAAFDAAPQRSSSGPCFAT